MILIMESLVKKLVKRPCITIDENSNIDFLIKLLNKNKIGCIVVVSERQKLPVGIISERDLIRNYHKIFNNKYIKVHELMTRDIIYCNKNTTSKELMEIMSNNKIRHIPIVDKEKLLGIVSIGDVVNRVIENFANETKLLREYISS